MSYPAIWLATATVGRHRCPQKRLQTARQPPVYPNSSPDHHACNSLTPFRCPHVVHPCQSVDSGLRAAEPTAMDHCYDIAPPARDSKGNSFGGGLGGNPQETTLWGWGDTTHHSRESENPLHHGDSLCKSAYPDPHFRIPLPRLLAIVWAGSHPGGILCMDSRFRGSGVLTSPAVIRGFQRGEPLWRGPGETPRKPLFGGRGDTTHHSRDSGNPLHHGDSLCKSAYPGSTLENTPFSFTGHRVGRLSSRGVLCMDPHSRGTDVLIMTKVPLYRCNKQKSEPPATQR